MSDNPRLLNANTNLFQPGTYYYRLNNALTLLNAAVAIDYQQSQNAAANTATQAAISTLQGQVATLQSQVATLESEVAALTARINAYSGVGPIP